MYIYSSPPSSQSSSPPMLYSPLMNDLKPANTVSTTFAGVLVVLTGCYWLTFSGLIIWMAFQDREYHGSRYLLALSVMVVVLGLSVSTVVVGFGVLYRRNWGRIFSVVFAGLWILFGWWELKPLLQLHGSYVPGGYIAINSFPIVAAIIWLALLFRKEVRMEFLPAPVVQIYVSLLGEGPPRSRVTRARALGNGLFELLSTDACDSGAERWEFQPGSIVRGVQARHDGEAYLLAASFDR